MRHNNAKRRATGVSLIEVVVCLLLTGVVLIGALNTTGSAARTTREAANRFDGRLAAHALLAEMLAMPYEDPNGEAEFGIESEEGETASDRSTFDDLDDYDGWTESETLTDREGVAMAVTESGWQRTADVAKIDASDAATAQTDDSADTGIRRLTVTVTSPDGQTTILQALRSDDGALEQTPAVDTTFVTGVIIELQAGGATVTDGASILNSASGP